MMTRRLAMAVLVVHIIVIALAIPVAVAALQQDFRPLLILLILQVLTVGALRTTRGVMFGWAVELLAVGLAFGNWALFGLNLIFLALWFLGIRWGNRIDHLRDGPGTVDV
jgi:hypothetical protein